MDETLLSWAIARNAAGMSDEQLADWIFVTTKLRVAPQLIRDWRRGEECPKERIVQNALAYTFGYSQYSYMLIPDDRVAMSVMIVAEDMGMPAELLRQIRLSKFTKVKLADQMRLAINITGDEQSAVGVAVAFWTKYMSKPHPILVLKKIKK